LLIVLPPVPAELPGVVMGRTVRMGPWNSPQPQRRLLFLCAQRLDEPDALADPAHDGDRHRVAERLVPRAVGREPREVRVGRIPVLIAAKPCAHFLALGCGVPLVARDERVVVGEPLEPLAFARRESSNPRASENDWILIASVRLFRERSANVARRSVFVARVVRSLERYRMLDDVVQPEIVIALVRVRSSLDRRDRVGVHAVARERDRRRVSGRRQRPRWIAGLRVAPILGMRELRRVEWDHDQGRGIALAGLAALSLERRGHIRAASKWAGNVFPRFSARRRIPAQARALKKYRSGRAPVSKISDNEDATPSLRNSEELSVKDSVGEPIPELDQPPEDGTKVPSFIR
jgi:hypothetical protein